MKVYEIVIIGAGPCGLGAAYRLKELGVRNFCIFERENYAGGLATSFKDNQGFWWDIGGHVQFSHYPYFDLLMDNLLGKNWLFHERESWVWIRNRFIPYPFQLNIHRLPAKERQECLDGLININSTDFHNPKNFEQWILQTSGAGIAKYFLLPYNFKVWAHQPKILSWNWVGERVAKTNLKTIEKNINESKDDISWGPNNTFRFPLKGGTGAIWQALAKKIGTNFIKYHHEVSQINSAKQIITFTNGDQIKYRYLINTMPLDLLVQKSDLAQKFQDSKNRLIHSTTHIVGVGLLGKPKEELKNKCWMYFPENNCPFYRVTLFSKYSPFNVPNYRKYWSLMTEISESEYKKVDKAKLVGQVIQGLINTKLISHRDKIVSTWQYCAPYGYPVPTIDRDNTLNLIQPELAKHNIYSRGRFGMWKYEVSNQDHSLMQGVEVADFIIGKKPEITAWRPDLVNNKKN